MLPVFVLLIFVSLSLTACGERTGASPVKALNIAAFNGQIFGQKKMANKNVAIILSEIVKKYDLFVLQEIRDKEQQAIFDLLALVNNESTDYELLLGPRSGSTQVKEQYAFFYRPDKIRVLAEYIFTQSPWIQRFERPPYVIHVEFGGIDTLVMPLHADPDDVLAELDTLVDMYQQISLQSGELDAILLGDFNSDCDYYSADQATVLQNYPFVWLLGDSVDTTTHQTDCAYDQIVMTADLFEKFSLVQAQVFNFQTEFGLTEELTFQVSDHYPVALHVEINQD
jgi:hypothetical protein